NVRPYHPDRQHERDGLDDVRDEGDDCDRRTVLIDPQGIDRLDGRKHADTRQLAKPERKNREAERGRKAPDLHFRLSIQAAICRRSSAVMSVSLPRGIASVTVTCVSIFAAL